MPTTLCQYDAASFRGSGISFLMFLIAHFRKVAAHVLGPAGGRGQPRSPRSRRIFRRDIQAAHANFLRLRTALVPRRSHQAQVRGLFDMTRRHLQLDALYEEVREELQDMTTPKVEAMRKQNDTVVRLTVVTTPGLVGTVTTGSSA